MDTAVLKDEFKGGKCNYKTVGNCDFECAEIIETSGQFEGQCNTTFYHEIPEYGCMICDLIEWPCPTGCP